MKMITMKHKQQLFSLFRLTLIMLFLPLNFTLAERNCDDEVLDTCAVNLFIYGNPDRRFGTSTDEVAAECRYELYLVVGNSFVHV